MTDQQPWGPDEDELVRRALASLAEDVDAMPLAEPEAVREMSTKGQVAHLPSRRHRVLGVVAGVAAAGLVATGAGFLTWNGSDVAPPSTSSTLGENPPPPSPASTSTGQEDLVVLGARDWAGALRRSVPATVTPASSEETCFTPSEGATWEHRVARGADGRDVGRQWVGTSDDDVDGMRDAVDAAVAGCGGEARGGGELADGTHRVWRVDSGPSGSQWWVEVRRGDQLSLLTFTERDGRRYTEEDARRLARGVLGELDLATRSASPTSASSTPRSTGDRSSDGDGPSATPSGTATSEAPRPTSTEAPSGTRTSRPGTTSPGAGPGSGSGTGSGTGGSGTSSGSATSTSASESSSEPSQSSSSTSSGNPKEVVLPGRHFVDASAWASSALTGGAATYRGPVEMEGSSRFTECTSADGDDRVGAIGIRSGPGEANYFGQQWVLVTDDAAERHTELLEGLRSGCTVEEITPLGQNVFRTEVGDLVGYIGVTRTRAGVTVLELHEAPTAPEPLTDDVARTEMGRLLGLAGGR